MHNPPLGVPPYHPKMSIAMSALVLPSKILFAMVSVLSLNGALISIFVSFGGIGRLDTVIGFALGMTGLLASVAGWLCYIKSRQTVHIFVTGEGQFKIGEILPYTNVANRVPQPVVVQLSRGSTLWTDLLLLRFQHIDGRIKSVVILPDCASKQVFGALSVACRWSASRGHANGQKESKI
ncbi:hypothetical protein [Glaciimonas immobilis]|uniref:Uncharacterized protein n=1 Tax=Glaciimonas immobilis TaxID=728004 RepID=A0A840RNN4_9BURK|nr:hypothetical protein [Glaciimonas immobilis]KAF3997957.1 hypothetical protein HAV38_10325 [Glaciimonas immobilis]MBB5199373.1 hypothetical protein [Glaciimonas immobilis]